MQAPQIDQAATRLLDAATSNARLDGLPADCRPADLAAGYAIQERVTQRSGRRVVGWKIAATSVAGQQHIGVDGPIAARLLSEHVIGSGLGVPLAGNVMCAAEGEFAFRMGRDLPPRGSAYAVDEVLAAADTLHPALEVPDSRYTDFAHVGAAQLIADAACARWLLVGPAATVDWRTIDLVDHAVVATKNGAEAARGSGKAVLGDPRVALAWLANEVIAQGAFLRAGDLVTTGACVGPLTVAEGDTVTADFGTLGKVSVVFF